MARPFETGKKENHNGFQPHREDHGNPRRREAREGHEDKGGEPAKDSKTTETREK